MEAIKKVFLKNACMFLSELLDEANTLLEESLKRRMSWQIKDRCTKRILTPLGTVGFTHTRFKNKETEETAYLLDRAVGWEAHTRISGGVKAAMLEGAARAVRRKQGKQPVRERIVQGRRQRCHGKQQGRSCEPCPAIPDEFPADGMEP